MPDLLTIEGLHAGYGEAVVLSGMSLSLPESQVLALLGRNGTGKTTLINSIVGITRRFGGTVSVSGLDLTAMRPDQRARAGIGWVPQERNIFRSLTLNPKVLLLDEPTEGLAPIIVEELLRALGTITRSGGICSIIVEQNAQKILGLADRVVILERGAIVHDAASHALKADPTVLERYLGVSGAGAP